MLNSDEAISLKKDVQSPTVSIILSTHNRKFPSCLRPRRVKAMIPKEVSSEIIMITCKQNGIVDLGMQSDNGPEFDSDKKINMPQFGSKKAHATIHGSVKGMFAAAIMRGVELSTGQFIIAIDADFPYPEDLIPMLIGELFNSPNSIIIASRYANYRPVQKLSYIRTIISKTARTIVKHGLKVHNVQDPLSSCFAISRQIIKNINVEGKGDELLLEILVKSNSNRKNNMIPVKEIPFSVEGKQRTKKLEFSRILSYSKAIWYLYLYGRKSERLKNNPDYVEQKRHKSVPFLSEAGRFFTVGLSGFVINYLVSLLIANAVSNIWYIHATLFGIIISINTNFFLNKVWTFEDRDFSARHFLKQYVFFFGICGLGAIIQLSLVHIFVYYSHIEYWISLIIAICVASLGNFLLNKKLTFGEKIWD
jgi:dolichol-phosphate mannosyltransferase